MDAVDPFDTGTLGDIGTLFESLDDKAFGSNMVYYQTPTFGGFSAEGSYIFGEKAGNTTTDSGYGVSVELCKRTSDCKTGIQPAKQHS